MTPEEKAAKKALKQQQEQFDIQLQAQKAAAEEWMAAKASLLNFFLVVIANLHKVSVKNQLVNLQLR